MSAGLGIDHTALVRDVVATCQGWAESVVVPATLLGVDAHLVLLVDREEQQRRSAARTGAVPDRSALRILSSLPLWHDVPAGDLSAADLRLLRALPAGVVEFSPGTVRRLARPPVALACGIVVDDDWSRGLDRASVFAAYAKRILALSSAPADTEQLVLEAGLYGIGVAVRRGDEVSFLAEPAAAVRRPVGPVGWRVLELAYRALLAGPAGPVPTDG